VAAPALSVAVNSEERATSPSAREARAARRKFAGINEHCATTLLSHSFFQVHRFLQHPRQQAPLLNGRALHVWRLAHRQWRVTPKTVLRHPLYHKWMLLRLLAPWLVSMSIVLCHFSHTSASLQSATPNKQLRHKTAATHSMTGQVCPYPSNVLRHVIPLLGLKQKHSIECATKTGPMHCINNEQETKY
jgi:hypothetical protein